MPLHPLLRTPSYRLLVVVLALVFFGVYTFFDFREGGREANLLTTRLAAPAFYLTTFGAVYMYGSIVLNAIVASLSALTITLAVANYRTHTPLLGGAVCSTATTLLAGFAVFGCPGCVLPLAGTLGITLFAKALPFLGLELKVVSAVLLAGTLVWLDGRARLALGEQPKTGVEPACLPAR